VILERAGAGGGTSAMSGGVLYLGGGTAIQRACGVEDSPEDMYRFLVAAVGPEPDRARIACYCDASVEHFDWLAACGVPFKPSLWPSPAWTPPTDDGLMWMGEDAYPFCDLARPAPRGHRPMAMGRSGWILMECLQRVVSEAGAQTEADVTVERLVTGDDGAVIGLVARRYGSELTIRARGGVVLASGGFVFNDHMLGEYAPVLLPHTKIGTDYDDGRAIRMAQAVGASTKRMDAGEGSINFSPSLMAAGIVVNAVGQRFVNEDVYPGRIGQIALYHQHARAYLVFDEEAYESVPDNLRHGRRPEWVCETVAELEHEMGLPERSLQTTIELYNHHAARGQDPLFRKATKWMRPLRSPFAAMDVRAKRMDGPPDPADRGTGFRVFTLGGLRTDLEGAVLNVDGDVIPGLFAAGRAASGVPGWGYISGTSLGDGTFFGRRAGAAAAAY
jgi:3-oxo-5alpha-steroid 4-dehydrogenase